MITLSLADLGWLVAGVVIGVLLGALLRRLSVLRHTPCRFCNGNGYFLSSGHEASVMDQVHQESASFRP